MKSILSIVVLLVLFVASCGTVTEEYNYDYKKCIISVDSPKSGGGFGTIGADWIASFMIKDNISNNRRIKYLPGMTKISDDGFYFYFYETCPEKLKWAKYYIERFIESHENIYIYSLRSLKPQEVDEIGIREIRKY